MERLFYLRLYSLWHFVQNNDYQNALFGIVCIPSTHKYTYLSPVRSRLHHSSYSFVHLSLRRLMVGWDRPLASSPQKGC